MGRIEYEKKKARAHSWTHREVEDLILSLEDREYRAILGLTFLTMSRISGVCTMRKRDVSLWKFRRKNYLLLAIGVEKRGGFAKLYPLVPERGFGRIHRDVVGYLKEASKGDPDGWLWSDPGIHTYTRKLRLRSGRVKVLMETDNKLRKRVVRYTRYHLKLNPHLFRHARYSILQWSYGLSDSRLQAIGGWKNREDMKPYGRYARPEEIAIPLMNRRRIY